MTPGASIAEVTKRKPAARRGNQDARAVVEIAVESPLWSNQPDAEDIVRRAIQAAAAAQPEANGEVSVVLTDDGAIQVLNRQWRKIDKPTNVLSFPAPAALGGAPVLLGDIVIAYETVAREAADEGKPLSHHLSHLAIHGYLHLLGWDHESETDGRDMEGLETSILAALGVPDPYATHEGSAPGHHA